MVSAGRAALFAARWDAWERNRFFPSPVRAYHHQPMEDKNNKVLKELGLFSLKKKIEDAIVRAEMIGPIALELEEASRIECEEVLCKYNLWDDLSKSNQSLRGLSNAIKVVNALKDLRYKAEEAKLITELAETDVINHQLFKQAYDASVDVSKFLDHYEMSKLLNGPYDKEGACVIIRAEEEDISSQIWPEKLLRMYIRWAEKHGCEGRVVEKYSSKGGGIKSATIEFESEYIYGYLSGEAGAHRMIRSSLDGSIVRETCSAVVDVIPLFLESATDLHIDDKDLEISSIPAHGEQQSVYEIEPAVSIHHIPSGIIVQCSGERTDFANKMKAFNRLKAKLLVVAEEQGVSDVGKIEKAAIMNAWKNETRKYGFHPQKLVQDMKTCIQLPGLNSVLDGNIAPLIRAHIRMRQGSDP